MRTVFLFMMTTVDGYFEGPNREIDWHHADEEFGEFANAQAGSADTLLFGRVTYELMAGYWPTPAAVASDPVVANFMNSVPKVVFSRTLSRADWQNTRLVREHPADEVRRLKRQPGKEIGIFGSSDLTLDLLQDGLVDEIRIMLNPVVLGSGKSLFKGLPSRLELKLLSHRTFRSGNILLTYAPARA